MLWFVKKFTTLNKPFYLYEHSCCFLDHLQSFRICPLYYDLVQFFCYKKEYQSNAYVMLFYFIVCVYKVSFCLNFTICSKKNNAFSRVVHLQCMRTARNNLTVGPCRDDGELGDVRVRVTEGGDEQLLLTVHAMFALV